MTKSVSEVLAADPDEPHAALVGRDRVLPDVAPVETVAGDGGAWAALRDWPATEDEQTKHRQQMRRAVEAASQAPADDSTETARDI